MVQKKVQNGAKETFKLKTKFSTFKLCSTKSVCPCIISWQNSGPVCILFENGFFFWSFFYFTSL